MSSNFWAGKNILITGHTGFKGSWLCLWLNKLGANINGLSLDELVSNPNLFSILELEKSIHDYRGDIIRKDICSRNIKKTMPDIIFHLAAQPLVKASYLDPLKTYYTNVIGTANVLEESRSCESVKVIVIITTDKCYENFEKNQAYVETDPLGGYDPYSSSKACAEHLASSYYRSFFKDKEVGLSTARSGNVIGGGDWAVDRLIPDAVKMWAKNETVQIRYPYATRPWQHVMEPLSGYLMLAEALWEKPEEFSGAWNFGPEQSSVKTVLDTVKIAANEWGDNANWESFKGNHPHEANLLQLNSEKAQSLLGWKPRLDFEKCVHDTMLWYKEYYANNPKMQDVTLGQIKDYENNLFHV